MDNASENAGENAGDRMGDDARPATKRRRAATTRHTPARHDGLATQEASRAAAPAPRPASSLASEPFSPGQPIRPTPGLSGGDGGPRQWAFPVGYNIAQFPRSTESTSFEQLRSLAALYDGAQLCERAYFDVLGRLELRALPRAELLAED